MEAAAIPGVAIPLLQDDCVNTTVDLDWVWDLIHLTSDDKTYRLDLDGLKTRVRGWFGSDALDVIMGPVDADDATARIARDYLEKGGKRWRPYLAACTYMALETDRRGVEPDLPEAVLKPPSPSSASTRRRSSTTTSRTATSAATTAPPCTRRSVCRWP